MLYLLGCCHLALPVGHMLPIARWRDGCSKTASYDLKWSTIHNSNHQDVGMRVLTNDAILQQLLLWLLL